MNTNEELIKDARAYLDDGLDDPKALVRALADRLAALTTAQEAKPCGIAHPFRDAVCVLPEGHEPGHMCEMALDGAPEPESRWEYRGRLQSCGYVAEGYISAEYAMNGLRVELEDHPYLVMDDTAIVERARVREWLPVEGEKP